MKRRTFLIHCGAALTTAACGSKSSKDKPDSGTHPSDDASHPDASHADATHADVDLPDAGVSQPWQLDPEHYQGYFPLHLIYPRPDEETETYARHRHAYPGLLYEIPLGVQFGKWPYRYELLEGPAGAFIVHETLQWNGEDRFLVPEGYGVVAWNTPEDAPAGPHVFRVRVYDQDHERPDPSFVDITWTVTVGVEQFVFLDTLGGDDATADGSISQPFREIAAMLDSGLAGDKICYIRQTALFDSDISTFSGGYVPNPPHQLRYGSADDPKAYVAYPGETVHINTVGQSGFARSSETNYDVFFDRLVTGFTNQANKDRDNVRVIFNSHRSRRSTFWRMGCIRAYGGNRKDDNHGFIWYWRAGGNVEDSSGHNYLYSADCWMDSMNVDPGPDAAFEGVGSNGAHLWETYTTNRTLAERHRVTNSIIVNNGFVINKGSARDGEIRACVSVKGNTGNYHIRAVGSDLDGETERVTLCYNKTGGSDNTSGRVSMGQAGNNPPYRDIIAYRNSCAGDISAASAEDADSHAYDNIAASIHSNVKNSSGNIEHGGDFNDIFDDEMHLSDPSLLGTKGADVA